MSSRPSRGAARLAAILDALPDALVLVNCNGTIVNANTIALETFEAPGTALVGRGLLDLLPTFDSDRIPGSMRRPRSDTEGGRTKPTRMIARRTDGSEFPVEVTSTNLEDSRTPYADASLRNYTGDELLMLVVRDLSGTVDTEAELARQQRQTEMILRAASEGVVGIDTDGRVVLVNPSAAQILGHRASDLGGKELHPLAHHTRADGSPLPYEETPLADTLRSGRKHRVRGQVLWAKDGSKVPVDLTTAPVRDGEQLVGAVMTFTDRRPYEELETRYKELEESEAKRYEELETREAERYAELEEREAGRYAELEEQEAGRYAELETREAERREALETDHKEQFDALAARHAQLLSVLGDSLRGPMDQLRTELGTLAADPAGQLWPEANQILHYLTAGYSRMTTLVDNVLSFQRLDAGHEALQRETVSLDTVVTAGVEGAIELIGPGRAQFAVHAPPLQAQVDPRRLSQALAHLIADVAGVDATGSTAGPAGAGDSTIVVAAAQRGEVARIEVRGPYAGGDPVHGPLVRGIVRLHGGVLQTHEVPGMSGSAFVLEVPLVGGESAAAEPGGSPAAVVPVPAQRSPEASAGSGAGSGAALQLEAAPAPAEGAAQPPAQAVEPAAKAPTGRRRAAGTTPDAAGTPGRPGPSGIVDPRTNTGTGTGGSAPKPAPAALPPATGAGTEGRQPTGRRRGRPSPAEEEAATAGAKSGAGSGRRARRAASAQAQAPAPAEVPGPAPAAEESFGAMVSAPGQWQNEQSSGLAPRGAAEADPAPAGEEDQAARGPVPPQASGPEQQQAGRRPGPNPATGAETQSHAQEPAAADAAPARPGRGAVPPMPSVPPAVPGNAPPAGLSPATQQQPAPGSGRRARRALGEAGRQPEPQPQQPPQSGQNGGRSRFELPPAAADRGPAPAGPAAAGHENPAQPADRQGWGDPGQVPGGPPAVRRPQPQSQPLPQAVDTSQSRAISVRTLGQGVPFARQVAEHQQRSGAPAQAPQIPAGNRPAGAPAPGQPNASPPAPAGQTGQTPAQPSQAGRRRKLAAPPEDGDQRTPSTGVELASRTRPRTAGGDGRSSQTGSHQRLLDSTEGRSFAIRAPDDGAEGPEPLDGPNGAVDVTDAQAVPPRDDEMPPEPLDNPRRLLVWPAPDPATEKALGERGYRPVVVHSRDEVDAQIAACPTALFVDPLTGPITRTALQSLRNAAVAAEIPVLVTAGLGLATREAAYGADPAVLLKALAPRDSEQHPPRVLLIEPDNDIAGALTAALERRGMQVARAAGDADAVTLAYQTQPNLVVMDLVQVQRRRAGTVDWLRGNGLLNRTPLVVYTSSGIDRAELPRLRSGETVLFVAERSTSDDVQERLVDLLSKIGTN